jgi:hypothetical protein
MRVRLEELQSFELKKTRYTEEKTIGVLKQMEAGRKGGRKPFAIVKREWAGRRWGGEAVQVGFEFWKEAYLYVSDGAAHCGRQPAGAPGAQMGALAPLMGALARRFGAK